MHPSLPAIPLRLPVQLDLDFIFIRVDDDPAACPLDGDIVPVVEAGSSISEITYTFFGSCVFGISEKGFSDLGTRMVSQGFNT